MRLAIVAVCFGLACGGATKSTNPNPGGDGFQPDQVSEDGDRGQKKVDPSAPPSAEQCDKFTTHVLELYRVEQRAKLEAEGKPELVPTDDQVAAIREEMSGECLRFPRAVVECGIAAKTFVAVADCQNKAPEAGE